MNHRRLSLRESSVLEHHVYNGYFDDAIEFTANPPKDTRPLLRATRKRAGRRTNGRLNQSAWNSWLSPILALPERLNERLNVMEAKRSLDRALFDRFSEAGHRVSYRQELMGKVAIESSFCDRFGDWRIQ